MRALPDERAHVRNRTGTSRVQGGCSTDRAARAMRSGSDQRGSRPWGLQLFLVFFLSSSELHVETGPGPMNLVQSPRPESNRILPSTRRVLDQSSFEGRVLAVRLIFGKKERAGASRREDLASG